MRRYFIAKSCRTLNFHHLSSKVKKNGEAWARVLLYAVEFFAFSSI